MPYEFCASEDSLFKARLNARTSQKDLLQGKVAQLTEEISGLEAQVASKAKQLELIAGEMTGVQELCTTSGSCRWRGSPRCSARRRGSRASAGH